MNKIQKSQISEREALVTIIQIYLSHTSKWYSSLIASLVSVIALPIIALNITIASDDPNSFDFFERSFFSAITLFLLLISVYLISKVNYSLALLEEIYESIDVDGTGKDLSKYIIERKAYLLSRIRHFQKLYRFTKDPKKGLFGSTLLPLFMLFIVGLFLFLIIWWNHDYFKYGLLLSGCIYGLLLWLLFRQAPIL